MGLAASVRGRARHSARSHSGQQPTPPTPCTAPQAYLTSELCVTKKLTVSVMNTIKVLALVDEANAAGRALPPDAFYNELISDKLDVEDHYVAWRQARHGMGWVRGWAGGSGLLACALVPQSGRWRPTPLFGPRCPFISPHRPTKSLTLPIPLLPRPMTRRLRSPAPTARFRSALTPFCSTPGPSPACCIRRPGCS